MGLEVEQKLNGFRCIAEKSGDRFRIKTEGGVDRTEAFGQLTKKLKAADGDYILDMSVGIDRDGEPLPRAKLMTLMADKPDLQENDVIKATCFDLPYWKDDIHARSLEYRRDKLEEFFDKYLRGDKQFALTKYVKVDSKDKLQSEFKKLSDIPQSEGIVIKDTQSIWDPDGSCEGWAKIKLELEAKVIVLKRHDVKGDKYNYTCGVLKGDSQYTNTTEFRGETYINLGKCFNTEIKANEGDILTVGVEEIIPQDDDLSWLGPRVKDIDKDRKEPYYAKQLVDMASRRGSVLQKDLPQEEGGEGETRSERAEEYWKNHWHESFPKSGKGKFVYHHHYRGLEEEETDYNEKELLETDHSLHGDLRCQYNDDYSWGFSVFTGEISDVREAGGFRLKKLPADDALQGAFKQRVPNEWLDVGKRKPYVAAPGEVGSTEKKYSLIIAKDWGDYEVGVWHKHYMEIFLHGNHLKGRYNIQYAEIGGSRKWLISKPSDQKPYAETHDKEDVIKELKGKGRKWLIWGKPGQEPEKIDLEKYDMSKQKSWEVPIIKAEEERYVYGIVLQPEVVDSQGDIVSAEEIEKAAHKFMEDCQAIGVGHKVIVPKIKIWESYIAPQDLNIAGETVKKGSWLLGVHVNDDAVWQEIKSGGLTSFSIHGLAAVN